MPRMRTMPFLLAATFALSGVVPSFALTPHEVRQTLAAAARAEDAAFAGFSAQRGETFFTSRHGREWSCATCHTSNPVDPGRHAKTGKAIAPLAPAANAERFTDPAAVEKWFRRNCSDVLGRTCTTLEKGDVVTYLLSKGGSR